MKRFPFWLPALLIAVLAGALLGGVSAQATTNGETYTISSLTLEGDQDELRLKISGDAPPTYTAYRLFDPPRLVIDIADARLPEETIFPAGLPQGPVRQVVGRSFGDQQLTIVRLEIMLAEDPEYNTTRRDHDIVVTFSGHQPSEAGKKAETSAPKKILPAADDAAAQAEAEIEAETEPEAVAAIIADLRGKRHAGVVEAVRPRIPSLEFHAGARSLPPVAKPEPKAEAPVKRIPTPAAAVAPILGEKVAHKVNVEFFKSDLHNVFRFFGEISGQNIVVDEAVSGQLTLTLRDVPWDFALDIVLNLKDLRKEERHNTIVISPRAKAFVWPERAADQLTIRADGTLAAPEALTVRQRLEVPKERLEARDLLREGSALEQRGEHERALIAYERALQLWPENSELATRAAKISLLHLSNNARALNLATIALRHDAKNDRAALLAAVAAANMQRAVEAKKYFDQSISQPQPAAEALISYAAFAEEYDSPHGALALLERHRQLFGDNLDTMITRARLHQKIGDGDAARQEYHAILFSGYELPDDLRRYIQATIAAEGE
ncbi:AMIN domain-containing protein [Desulfurivibrio sp. D14AmB]|uniref:AMIN domain-containing protein n=1 Tax=Desulfurivibrio sp. D14AmB TaxID=3374370 RepID=UPI00376F013B